MFDNFPKVPPLLSLGFSLGCILVILAHAVDFPQTFNPYILVLSILIVLVSYLGLKEQ